MIFVCLVTGRAWGDGRFLEFVQNTNLIYFCHYSYREIFGFLIKVHQRSGHGIIH